MTKLNLYHGSPNIISKPEFGKGKLYNDYGKGFYCTEHIELAKEWACSENTDGYINQYEIETKNLTILNLSKDHYTILHWLALLVEYRKFRISSPLMKRGAQYLREHFLIDLSPYDLIIGYRADDSYFSFARAFLNNEISLHQLNYSMRLGKLGEQIVVKSPLAFERLTFQSFEIVDHTEYYAKRKVRDDRARRDFFTELEKEDLDGIYMRDIIREEMTENDPRLRQYLSR